MISIWIKNLELFEEWIWSSSSNIECLDYYMTKGMPGSESRESLSCYLTFKNGKKAIVQVK